MSALPSCPRLNLLRFSFLYSEYLSVSPIIMNLIPVKLQSKIANQC